MCIFCIDSLFGLALQLSVIFSISISFYKNSCVNINMKINNTNFGISFNNYIINIRIIIVCKLLWLFVIKNSIIQYSTLNKYVYQKLTFGNSFNIILWL